VKPWNAGAVIHVNQQHMYCDSISEQKFGCDTGKCCVCVIAAGFVVKSGALAV
jgi:hypothetical protein